MNIFGIEVGRNIAKLYETNDKDPWRGIDTGIRPLVREFNEIPGLQSHSSCSGHPDPVGDVYDGLKEPHERVTYVKTKKGPTINYGIIPHLAFTGDTQVAVDYLNFLGDKLAEHDYRGQRIFQFKLDRENWTIEADHTSKWNADRIGYWELMANWEMLRRFTADYKNGAKVDPKKIKPYYVHRAKHWRNLEHLIGQLEQVEELKVKDT